MVSDCRIVGYLPERVDEPRHPQVDGKSCPHTKTNRDHKLGLGPIQEFKRCLEACQPVFHIPSTKLSSDA